MKNLLLLALLYSVSFFAQEENQLPNFIMPSPQAFEFTKYGDVSSNENTGRFNLSIPIDNYKVGSINVPIGLHHSGSGVKVNQLTTWTGINWNLQAGGVITRTVHDLSDENPATLRIFTSELELSNMSLATNSSDAPTVYEYLELNSRDTEVDVFYFSFMGTSGSFYLNEEGKPEIFVNSSNLKIEILGNLYTDKEFVITDSNGTKYYFGGENASEDSQTRVQGQVVTTTATTAYYLKKIVSYLGEEVYFEYQNIGTLLIQLSRNKTRNISKELSYQCTTPSQSPGNCCCPGHSVPSTSYSNTTNRIYGAKFLSKILNNKNNLTVNFNTINSNNNKISSKILDNIEIKESTNVINKTTLVYDYYSENGMVDCDRFFLNKVIAFNQNGVHNKDKEIYELEYNTPEDLQKGLPERFSYNQDHLGYFNGTNNYTNLPQIEGEDIGANKNPSFEHASKGVLKKIIYPTKGYAIFDYESHKKKKEKIQIKRISVFNNPSVPNHDLINTLHIGNNLSEGTGEAVGLGIEPVETSGVTETQEILIKFGVQAPDEPIYLNQNGVPMYDVHYRDFLRFKITDHTPNPDVVHYVVGNSSPYQNGINLGAVKDPVSGDAIEFPFTLIKDHNYSFQLEMFSQNNGGNPLVGLPNSLVRVEAFFEYVLGDEYVEDLGVRIKRIANFTKDEKPESIKRYYYKEAGKFDESLVNVFNPIYKTEYLTAVPCNLTAGVSNCVSTLACSWNRWMISSYSSESFNNLFFGNENTASYEYITISYGGDNFEKGGIQKKFTIDNAIGVIPFHEPNEVFKSIQKFGNSNSLNGTLKQKISLANIGSTVYKIKKEGYNWGHQRLKTIPNMVGNQAYSICYFSDYLSYEGLYIGFYNNYIFKQNLIQQTTTDYIQPLALGADENSVEKMVTTVDYEYGDLAGLPIKTTSTNSDGKQQVLKNYYPDQVTLGSVLNLQPALTASELTSISNLKSQNRISPIQVESYEKVGVNPEVLLSAQRSLYKEDNGHTVLKNVSSSKNSSDFEERVVYHKYDAKGNPLELSKTDGTKVVYKWATTHRKPLAKIVNASLVEVQNVTGDLRADLPKAQVTTYTYTGPLNLLSTVTDPRGYTTNYTYDEFNRLKFVKDAEGNILSKNQYNYKTN